MLFTDIYFWVGLPLVLGVFFLVRRSVQLRTFVLLIASFAFYALIDVGYLWLLLDLTLFGYLLGLAIPHSQHRKFLLFLGILLGVGILVVFKYIVPLGFAFTSPSTVLLPLGLSFYLFQIMGYLVDVYRGTPPERNILVFALSVAFFPKIVAGPVERIPAFCDQAKRALVSPSFQRGFFLLGWGLVQKFCIADNAALIADGFLGTGDRGVVPTLIGMFAFTLQIYADFSGYTDIARGLALFFGFDLAQNFRQPYFALTPSDFWRRWHISLSNWFRDYVYIPLGGNRKGEIRVWFNLFLTMVLVGAWHGSHPRFILWGAYQGLLLCLTRAGISWISRIPPFISRVVTFLLMMVGWFIFYSPPMKASLETFSPLHSLIILILLWIPIILVDLFAIRSEDGEFPFTKIPVWYRFGLSLAVFYALFFLPPMISRGFYYARF